ncbi:MAG: zf-HC2 domain-containing protein [Candidatus Obscuribacterales bacterium]|jgi:anti-sigma factor RsiW|nr:zf-HC2 domain-containing protein [Candidatus Obscuribacterales bacterium]
MSIEPDNLSAVFSDYFDGELSPGKKAELEDLFQKEEKTRVEFESFSQSITFFRSAQTDIQAKCPDLWPVLAEKLPSVCLLIQEDLSAYLDGELLAPAKEGVSEHLQSCPPCHEQFQGLSQINGLISKGLSIPSGAEADLWSQLKNRLNADCLLIKEELSSFYDREVTPPRHRAVTSHLLECAECRNQLSSITQSAELIKTHYQPDIPEEFDIWPQLKSRINVLPFAAKERRRRNFLNNRKFYGVAAAIGLGIMAATTFVLNFHSASTIQPVTAESYLIESALGEPAESAEAIVYENQ